MIQYQQSYTKMTHRSEGRCMSSSVTLSMQHTEVSTYQILQIVPFYYSIAKNVKALQECLVVISAVQLLLNFLAENECLTVHAWHEYNKIVKL